MRLINPAKTEVGRLSKCIMETMNKELTKVEYELVEKCKRSHRKTP